VTKQTNSARRAAASHAGFTLIEILAVVLILGLLMSLMIPAIGAGGGRNLRKQGDRVAATLELARQRAVVTGKPHRVALDLGRGRFGVEWLVTEARAFDEEIDEGPQDGVGDGVGEGIGDGVIDLAPPLEDELAYYPIPNRFGAMEPLERGYFFEGVDTPEGWIETGEAFVSFDWDGSTDAAQIVISDPDNRTILLDVAPLLETVRIREEVD
jgi:prepilin-type N-terminal cleavage/methylation domain-containing protein